MQIHLFVCVEQTQTPCEMRKISPPHFHANMHKKRGSLNPPLYRRSAYF